MRTEASVDLNSLVGLTEWRLSCRSVAMAEEKTEHESDRVRISRRRAGA